jgi:pilus assembly protein FimV
MHNKLNPSSRNQLQPTAASLRVTAISAALGVLLSMVHVDASALAMGRITSLSSLGEPLVAGIEIPDINAEEAASLKATLASPEAFRAAGLEYNTAMGNVEITLNKRANGSSYLLLRSDKVVSDPFLNLVVNANWSTGRITRNYTLLLDPPESKQSEAAALANPISALPAPSPAPSPAPARAPAPVSAPAPAVTSSAPAVLSAPAPSTPVAMPRSTAAKPSTAVTRPQAATQTVNSGEQIKVAAGETAGRIAAKNLPANVSLDQMLVAMLRGNPQAFIGGNVNRLKAGAILDLPTEYDASAITTTEARQSLRAQSRDFNNFRKKLAENAPTMASKATDRVASGNIEAKVEDKKAPAATPDKLTLSKGGLKTDEKAKENLEKIAKEKQAKADAERTAELTKNLNDLKKIAGAAPIAPSAPAVAAPAAPTTATVPATTVAAAATTTTPAAAVAPVVPAAPVIAPPPKPPAAAAVKKPAPPVAPVEKSFIDGLVEDPVVLPAALGLLALLLGGGWFAYKRRKQRLADEDDAALGDDFQQETFFNNTSNEPVLSDDIPDIYEKASAPAPVVNPVTAKPSVAVAAPVPAPIPAPVVAVAAPVIAAVSASAITSAASAASANNTSTNTNAKPSVSATTVDPLTEADVYLDYGRDVQAEEILKAALKTQPQNVVIYTKLMGIYSKRRDVKNFEQMALKAKAIVTESDPQWETISKQGFELEPSNPLYAAGAPDHDDDFDLMANSEFSTRTVAQLNPETSRAPASVDLDLDFDFASSFPTSNKLPEASKTPLIDFPDFSLEPTKVATAATAAVSPAMATTAAAVASVAAAAMATPATAATTTAKPNAMEYDLAHLSLDLNTAKTAAAPAPAVDMNGPLETKLALAQEFRSIGDNIGAKMLVNEVIANATGPLKLKAENLLAEMA